MRVLDRLEVADALALGDPHHERVQCQPRRPAAGRGPAAPQRRVQLRREPFDQIVAEPEERLESTTSR